MVEKVAEEETAGRVCVQHHAADFKPETQRSPNILRGFLNLDHHIQQVVICLINELYHSIPVSPPIRWLVPSNARRSQS